MKDEDYFLIPTAEVPVTNLHERSWVTVYRSAIRPIRLVSDERQDPMERIEGPIDFTNLTRLNSYIYDTGSFIRRAGTADRSCRVDLAGFAPPLSLISLCTGIWGFLRRRPTTLRLATVSATIPRDFDPQQFNCSRRGESASVSATGGKKEAKADFVHPQWIRAGRRTNSGGDPGKFSAAGWFGKFRHAAAI